MGRLAPQLKSIADVITRKDKCADANINALVKLLLQQEKNHFSTLYKHLLQVGSLTNKNRVDISPSLFFIFLTHYNMWLHKKVFHGGDNAILSGGIYVKATENTNKKEPLDVLKFCQNSSSSDDDFSNVKLATRISQFSLADSDTTLNNVYRFAAIFFDSLKEASRAKEIKLTKDYVEAYIEKEGYSSDSPMITQKTEVEQSPTSPHQSPRMPSKKRNAKRTSIQPSQSPTTNVQQARSSSRKKRKSNTKIPSNLLHSTITIGEADIKKAFIKYAGVIQLNTKNEQEKGAFFWTFITS